MGSTTLNVSQVSHDSARVVAAESKHRHIFVTRSQPLSQSFSKRVEGQAPVKIPEWRRANMATLTVPANRVTRCAHLLRQRLTSVAKGVVLVSPAAAN